MSANVKKPIAYAARDEMPWHGLGNPVGEGMTIEDWKKAGNLDWDVIAAQVEYTIGKQRFTMDHKVLVRSDNPEITFGTVGPIYTPWQNSQILEFFREYVEAGDMKMSVVGALGDGEYVWALAEMDREFNLGTKKTPDNVSGYVLIANPHKYGKGARIKFTTVRAVCANTIAMALSGSGDSLTLPHTYEFNTGAQKEAKEKLGIAREQMEAFEQDASKLVETTLTTEDADQVLKEVFGDQARVIERVRALYDGEGIGSKLTTAAGTGWGLLNAVTEYYDHHSGNGPNTRLKNAWYGGGASKKLKMMDTLLQRVG